MAEEVQERRPTIWTQALRVLRGGDTALLVERFTQEVTLVAEGLCEDQARLRRAIEELTSSRQEAEQQLGEMQQLLHALEARLTEMSARVALMERQRLRGRWLNGKLPRVTTLLCGAVLVAAVLRLFR